MVVVWVIALALMVIVAGMGFNDFGTAKSSPQQAAAVAAALLGVVTIYAIARAIDAIAAAAWRGAVLKALAARPTGEAASPAQAAGAVPAFPIVDAPAPQPGDRR